MIKYSGITDQMITGIGDQVLRNTHLSEVRRLLHMSSGNRETYLVIDNSGTIIMSDYGKHSFYTYAKKIKSCSSNITYEIIDGEKYSLNCSLLTYNNSLSPKKNIGKLFSFTKYDPFIKFSSTVIYFILILVVLFLTLIFFLRKTLYKQLLKPILALKNHILDISNNDAINPKINEIKELPLELVEIKDAFERLLVNLQEEYQGRIEAEKMQALVDIAAGVCHDIRSPVSILEMCLTDAKAYLPAREIELQIEALQSIRDIANNLLDKYRSPDSIITHPPERDSQERPLLISSIIDLIISQKKQEWKSAPCKIILKIEPNARNKWINSIDCEVKRVLSNILNNAYEALKGSGIIEINLKSTNNELILIISDNGVGISSEKIVLAMNGLSSKHQGKGIGLLNAKQFMEHLGGGISINSQENIGTQVTLRFPFYSNPNWLPKDIILERNQTVVLLDDDNSIHDFWAKRLQNISIPLIQFYSGKDFIEWYGKSKKSDSLIFIMDYELRGEIYNGLDLLKSINPHENGYLVTSHAERHIFQKIAEELDIWLIPKCILNEIPLKLTQGLDHGVL